VLAKMIIKSYKDLEVWQKSIDIVKEVYAASKSFPKDERFGLTSQIRRSAISIPSNIAEGKSRQHINEYIQFLYIAFGSSSELNTQLLIAGELQFLSNSELCVLTEKLDHVSRMLQNLIKSLKRKPITVNREPK